MATQSASRQNVMFVVPTVFYGALSIAFAVLLFGAQRGMGRKEVALEWTTGQWISAELFDVLDMWHMLLLWAAGSAVYVLTIREDIEPTSLRQPARLVPAVVVVALPYVSLACATLYVVLTKPIF